MAIGPKVELFYDGAWNDITADARTKQDILMTRGRADESANASPASLTLQLRNGYSKVNPAVTGRYSPRNPRSDLYGKIGRNTPLRVRVGDSAPRLALPAARQCYVSTPDHAALDITGDLDIRMELQPASWRPPRNHVIASKYDSGSGDQRSWICEILPTGALWFAWSPNGTLASRRTATSTAAVPDDGARRAIRITIDVNNGAAGTSVAFYTAPAIGGSWTQLGATVTTGGTTSIHSGTAAFEIGSVSNGVFFVGESMLLGDVYALQLRSGIGGTVVASPDFSILDAGATTFTDSAGRTFTIHGGAAITDPSVRACAEIAGLPQRWDPSGVDAWVTVEAKGVLRRLDQGAPSLRSALYRGMTGDGITRPRGYWPCEDGADATTLASAFAGHPPLGITPDVDLASFTEAPATDAIPTITTGTLNGRVPGYPSGTHARFMAFAGIPEAITGEPTIWEFVTTGTAWKWRLSTNSTGGLRIRVTDRDGTVGLDSTIGFGILGQRGLLWVLLTQDGNDVGYEIGWMRDGSTSAGTAGGTYAGHTKGVIREFGIGRYSGDLQGMAIGHITVLDTDEFWDIAPFARAWAGETAVARILRLATEEQVPVRVIGLADGSEVVGAQRIGTFLELVRQAADVDHGVLTDDRDAARLLYRPRLTLLNQTPVLGLDYDVPGHLAPPLEPVEDDQLTRNDITVERPHGSSARAVLDEGPLSVLPPPAGVGRYDDSHTINAHADGRLRHHAGWLLRHGTIDEPRYPVVQLRLQKPALAAQLAAAKALEAGDRITISNLPEWMPPGDADLIVQNIEERIAPNEHEMTLACTPAAPFTVAVADDADLGRADTAGSQLTADATSSATTLGVLTTVGVVWTQTPAQFPFDCQVAGEIVTVTDIDAAVADAFTRSVSNGWGAADSGQAWTCSGGSAANFSANGSRGLVALSTVNVHRRCILANSDRDIDIRASVATDKVATGNWIVGALLGRWVDASNHYKLQVEFKHDGNVGIGLVKTVAGVGTGLGGHVLGSYSAAERFNVRFAIYGNAIGGKIWRVGSPEPAWQIFVVDDDLDDHGAVGMENLLVTGNTNTLPVVLSWDDVASRMQRFTVVRAVNGVDKAQLAGADIRLAQPAIAAL